MSEYYYLASLLPPLEIGHVPTLGFSELRTLLDENLTKDDKRKVHTFLSLIDFENLRALWVHEPFDPHGNLNREQMESALADGMWPWGVPFPFYFSDFLEKYRTERERLAHYSLLMSLFFQDKVEHETGFLRAFFSFQRDMRLVMVGFRAKRLGRDVSAELQYEDPTDPLVAQILAQKDSGTYEPPFEYKELKPIFEEFADSPLELHKEIFQYQFNHIVEFWGGELFNLDRILNYMARLILVERWLELDVQKGIAVVDTIEKEIR